MVRFGKNKDDTALKKHRLRYALPSAEEEITDILLTEKNKTPLAEGRVEPNSQKQDEIPDAVRVEDNNTTTKAPMTATLNEQVDKLCREYAAINERLERSLSASNDLTKQLEKSKKIAAASYLAIGCTGLALLIGIAAIVVGVNLQRDVADLRNSVTSLADQIVVVKKETALESKAINDRIAALNNKADKILAIDELDNVLQVTQELRKQLQILASKDLTQLNASNQILNEPPQAKISLPSLKPGLNEE